jgi:hypothetical protein
MVYSFENDFAAIGAACGHVVIVLAAIGHANATPIRVSRMAAARNGRAEYLPIVIGNARFTD